MYLYTIISPCTYILWSLYVPIYNNIYPCVYNDKKMKTYQEALHFGPTTALWNLQSCNEWSSCPVAPFYTKPSLLQVLGTTATTTTTATTKTAWYPHPLAHEPMAIMKLENEAKNSSWRRWWWRRGLNMFNYQQTLVEPTDLNLNIELM